MIYRLLLACWICLSATYAMLSDGIHVSQDYINFAKTHQAFQASCFVYDRQRHVLQTGVLIAPDIVMTAAHGFEGNVNLRKIVVGFGDTVSRESPHNYKVKALRMHPGYREEEYPLQAKYDMVFLKLETPVQAIQPIPVFEKQELSQIPPLSVATFGSADIPHGMPVQRRAFVLPETDIFPISGDDPDVLSDVKTVMLGSIFFEPQEKLVRVKPHAPEKDVRTYQANVQWRKLNQPPYGLALPGSSGAPVFIEIKEKGKSKTYVFGIIQSFSHLSAASFRHPSGDRETHHLLKTKRQKVYGRYQTVFCIPYEVEHPLRANEKSGNTYRLSPIVKKILEGLEKKK